MKERPPKPIQDISAPEQEQKTIPWEKFSLTNLKWPKIHGGAASDPVAATPIDIVFKDTVMALTAGKVKITNETSVDEIYTITLRHATSVIEGSLHLRRTKSSTDSDTGIVRRDDVKQLPFGLGAALCEKIFDFIQIIANRDQRPIHDLELHAQSYKNKSTPPERWREIFEPIFTARGYHRRSGMQHPDAWEKIYQPIAKK